MAQEIHCCICGNLFDQASQDPDSGTITLKNSQDCVSEIIWDPNLNRELMKPLRCKNKDVPSRYYDPDYFTKRA